MYRFFYLICCFLYFTSGFAQSKKYFLDNALTDKDILPHTLIVKFKNQTTASNTLRQAFVPEKNQAIQAVGGKLTPTFPNLKNKVNSITNFKTSVSVREKIRQEKEAELSQVFFVKINPALRIQDAINRLLQDDNIIYAEPVFQNYTPLYVPNDPLNSNNYYPEKIKVFDAWDVQKGNPSMIIGIVDAGFDITHEDLTANMVPGRNVADDNTSFAGGDKSHGTFVAGFAAATPDNNKGITGVGFNCKFMPIRYSSDVNPNLFAGYQGIVYAVDNGCKVVCLSWGRACGGYVQSEQDIINYAALVKDAVVVAAAGNVVGNVQYFPASYDNVMSVSFTDSDDSRSVIGGGTNTGCALLEKGATYSEKVKIVAPGRNLYGPENGNIYSTNSGSSFAAPLVAGAAALVRVQYPSLNSQQVIRRLSASSDNIYSVPRNQGLQGFFGTGRLNVYKALTESVLKAPEATHSFIKSAQNQPYFLANQVTDFSIEVTNFLSPLSNLQVSLRTASPYLEIRDSVTTFGAMTSGMVDTNSTDPFKVYVKPNTPANTQVPLYLVFTDGSFSFIQAITVTLNPDYLDVNINQLLATVTSKGRLGFNDDANTQGKGFVYKPADGSLLYEGGMIAGVSSTKTADAIRVTSIQRNQSFQVVRPITINTQEGIDFSASAVFADTSAPAAERVGITVTQNTMAWKDTPNDKYFIQEYKVKNISQTDYPALYMGWFTDWDIQGYDNNTVNWDSTLQMGYAYNTSRNNAFTGIALLTPQSPQFYALDYEFTDGVWVYDSFTKAEKFQSVSKGVFRKQSTPNSLDVAYSIAAKTDTLRNNQSQTVAFAFLAGDNLNDLKNSLLQAQVKYRSLRLSPSPTVADLTVCQGDTIKITPKNGKIFKFYAKGDAAKPIFTGTTFKPGKALRDTVFYVAGADSVFESQRMAVSVKVFTIQANFANAARFKKDTLIFPDDSTMNFTDKSTNAIKWKWDFGDGGTSTLQNPSHTYKVLGTYTITLTVENSIGCKSTFSKKIKVLDLTTAVDPEAGQVFRIYPNPAQNKVFIEKPDSLKGTPCEIGLMNSIGEKIKTFVRNEDLIELDISSQVRGIYFLKILAGKSILIKRIVLQ
jgi:subtilisin family serine protease